MQRLKQDKLESQHQNNTLQNELDQARSEIDLVKKQSRMYFEDGEQLTYQLNDLRDKLTQKEHQIFNASSTHDMQLREVQMLKNQLNQANMLIEQYQQTNQTLINNQNVPTA